MDWFLDNGLRHERVKFCCLAEFEYSLVTYYVLSERDKLIGKGRAHTQTLLVLTAGSINVFLFTFLSTCLRWKLATYANK